MQERIEALSLWRVAIATKPQLAAPRRNHAAVSALSRVCGWALYDLALGVFALSSDAYLLSSILTVIMALAMSVPSLPFSLSNSKPPTTTFTLARPCGSVSATS